jgi:type I restriction enzyme, S subunit
MRDVARVTVSNVDKNASEDEEPVRLCNYVDVYRNDWILPNMEFMHATASKEEITNFRLQTGDVIITKDSEDWRDIGVPAFVAGEARDLVCGYHLAILRPHGIDGRYLLRCLQSPAVNTQWRVRATGVTRYGLTQVAIKDLHLPLPTPTEQETIAHFLDATDHDFVEYLRGKRRLLHLLQERKSVVVDSVLASGLDAQARLVTPPIRSFGNIPSHWDVRPMKWHFREVDERSESGTEELLSVSHITGVTPRSVKNITMFMAASYAGHKVCRSGDLVVNTMWAWMGALGVSAGTGLVSPSYGVYRLLESSPLRPEYAELLLRSRGYVAEYVRRSTGIRSSRLRLYPDDFLRIPMICPPQDEQASIVRHLHAVTTELDRAIDMVGHAVARATEFRTRLIEDAVLGRLDLRAAADALPGDMGTADVAGTLDAFDDAHDEDLLEEEALA